VGLCSCVFDDRRELPFPGKIEQCRKVLPLLDWFSVTLSLRVMQAGQSDGGDDPVAS